MFGKYSLLAKDAGIFFKYLFIADGTFLLVTTGGEEAR